MAAAKAAILTLYVFAFSVLWAFGLHRFRLARLYVRRRRASPQPRARYESLPSITVQLPVYNEMYVVERLIGAACAIDYPRHLLEIQVLDDSTDATRTIARKAVRRYRRLGHDITYIHRPHRSGFKAGALEGGLRLARGELIAVFDADFLPPPHVLHEMAHFFTDPRVGIVQARWGHLNRDYSTLTRTQAVLLDGHFIVEQTARQRGGFFLNFNGTAGMLRRRCIEEAGGWQHDTLTEDLDLSYRAQLLGWKVVYLKDTVVPAELPVDMNAFKAQQHRWTKGAIQTATKLLGRVLASPSLGPVAKLEAALHLLGPVSYLLLMVLVVLMFPMGVLFHGTWGMPAVVAFNFVALGGGMATLIYFYSIAAIEGTGRGWIKELPYVVMAIALGMGLAVNNSRAVVEALARRGSEFRRTPKFNVVRRGQRWKTKLYVTPGDPSALVELALGGALFAQSAYALSALRFEWLPFLIPLATGFLYTALLSLAHAPRRRAAAAGGGAS